MHSKRLVLRPRFFPSPTRAFSAMPKESSILRLGKVENHLVMISEILPTILSLLWFIYMIYWHIMMPLDRAFLKTVLHHVIPNFDDLWSLRTRFSSDAGACEITLNRPAKLNALNLEMNLSSYQPLADLAFDFGFEAMVVMSIFMNFITQIRRSDFGKLLQV